MKKIFLLLCIAFSLLMSCSNSSSNIELNEMMVKAEELYKEALLAEEQDKKELFSRSAILFEEAQNKGELDNGYIYFNIGNSWFGAGELGKAILNYRKAEKRLPANDLVKRNLEIARFSVPYSIPEEEENVLLRTLLFLHFDLSVRSRSTVLVTLLVLIIVLLSIRLFRKYKIFKNSMIVLIILTTINCFSLIISLNESPQGVIIQNITARQGDSEGYEPSFVDDLPSGVEFKLIEERGSWINIQLKDDRTCWVPKATVSFIQ